MQKVFYQHLIQFLIALAVGTLAGDALLHLLPHAFLAQMSRFDHHSHEGEHHHDHEQHDAAVWLGLVALVSMIGFFVFEKIVNIVGDMRERRDDDRKLRVVREGHVVSDKARGETVCMNKYSDYCASELEDLDLEERDGMMVKESATTNTLVENGVSKSDSKDAFRWGEISLTALQAIQLRKK